jgi:serine/threonine protein kinase
MNDKQDSSAGNQPPDPRTTDDFLQSWDPGQSEVLKSFNVDSISVPADDAIRIAALAGFSRTVALEGTTVPAEDVPAQPSSAHTMVKSLGQGGFGEVWEARQNQLGRAVALKLIRRDICPSRDASDTRHQFIDTNLRQEALTAAMLDHPNIVPVYDLQQDERGFPVLAMKLVRGQAWDTALREDFAAMPAEEFLARHLTILVSVAQAVAFAHSRGIIHRDLKPGQVMLGDFGEVLLMDWGLATIFDPMRLTEATQAPPLEIMSVLATASNPAGTPAYMAPEQTDSVTSRIGPWTDTYLLGGILYHLLCGAPPRDGSSVSQVLSMAREGQIVPLTSAAPNRPMPAELVALCHWCLQPDPAKRPRHAGEVLEALKAYQSGAGKRSQSRELASEAAQTLAQANSDYVQLAKSEELMGRAFELWPENSQLAQLMPQLRLDFSQAAIGKGDLELAQLHASRAREADKLLLLSKIDSARRLQRRKERERRIATVLTIAALVIIVAGTLYYNQRVKSALSDAVTARGEAETMIAGLQENLFGELDAIGKMGILAELGEQIDSYYQRMGTSSETGQSRLRHVQSLLALQQAQSRIGKRMEARQTSAQAVEQATQLVASNPKSQDYLALLVCAQTRLAGQ